MRCKTVFLAKNKTKQNYSFIAKRLDINLHRIHNNYNRKKIETINYGTCKTM